MCVNNLYFNCIDTCYEALGDTKKAKQMNSHRDRAILPGPGKLSLFVFCDNL